MPVTHAPSELNAPSRDPEHTREDGEAMRPPAITCARPAVGGADVEVYG